MDATFEELFGRSVDSSDSDEEEDESDSDSNSDGNGFDHEEGNGHEEHEGEIPNEPANEPRMSATDDGSHTGHASRAGTDVESMDDESIVEGLYEGDEKINDGLLVSAPCLIATEANFIL